MVGRRGPNPPGPVGGVGAGNPPGPGWRSRPGAQPPRTVSAVSVVGRTRLARRWCGTAQRRRAAALTGDAGIDHTREHDPRRQRRPALSPSPWSPVRC